MSHEKGKVESAGELSAKAGASDSMALVMPHFVQLMAGLRIPAAQYWLTRDPGEIGLLGRAIADQAEIGDKFVYWRPSSNKPPSQKTVIAYVPNYGYGNPRRVRAIWLEPLTLLADLDYSDESDCDSDDNGDLYVPGGWYEDGVYYNTQELITDEVTHWTELPPAPLVKA